MPFSDLKPFFLSLNQEPEFKIIDVGAYRIGYFLCRSKVKTNQDNEDCLFLSASEKKLYFGVADGAGGHPRGSEASKVIAEEITKNPLSNTLELIERANQKVIDIKAGAKSTLAFGTIREDRVRFFSVGDSEILYWNAQGSLIFASTPHSLVGHKVKAGLLDQEESLKEPDRYIVNHLMGDEFISIETTNKAGLKKGHTILVGSDGLFDNISHEKLTELVGKGSFEKSFEELVKTCSEQNPDHWLKDDDISFVVVRKIKSE